MLRSLAARAVTGPPAFLLAGVIDLVAFAAASLRARLFDRSRVTIS